MSRKTILIWTPVFLMLLFGTVTQTALSKDIELAAPWVPHSITLDGKRTDWPESSVTFLKDQEASVGVCTDAQNLYIMLSFRDPKYARLVRMSGLTLYLDAGGKNHKDFWLRFNGGPSFEQMREMSGRGGADSSRQLPPDVEERMRERDQNFENTLVCFQKDRITEKPIPMDGSEGPAAAFGVDEGFFVYEFRVPLKESAVRYYGLGAMPGGTISVGMVWGEFDREAMRGSRGDDGMGHVGIGGMPGGMPEGMGEGRRRGGEGGFPGEGRGGRDMPKKQEVWLKAKLSNPSGEESAQPN